MGKGRSKFIIPFEIDLYVSSVPEGADVFIDGKKIQGKTPLTQKIDAGRHSIRLDLDGFTKMDECVIDTSIGADKQTWINQKYWKFA